MAKCKFLEPEFMIKYVVVSALLCCVMLTAEANQPSKDATSDKSQSQPVSSSASKDNPTVSSSSSIKQQAEAKSSKNPPLEEPAIGKSSSSVGTADKKLKLEEPQRPNVVIFIADDLGIGDVGCFGNTTIKTPNIDRIAHDGAKLAHNLAAEALCTPSRAALLTGRYPIRSGMSAFHRMRVMLHTSAVGGLPANETTIGEAAKSVGYTTGFIGKWHLGLHCGMYDLFCHHPLKQGFDYYYGIPLTNLKDFGSHGHQLIKTATPKVNGILISLAAGGLIFILFLRRTGKCGRYFAFILFFVILFPAFYVYISMNNLKFLNSLLMRNLDVVEQPIDFEHVTQNLVNEGINFLKETKRGGRPFLLVMSWLQVHTVLHASKRFQGKSLHGDYGDNVEEMDWSVGEIMKALERFQYLDNTLVYFTSDNGGHLEESLDGKVEGGWNGIYRGGKGQGGMDGGIRLPTVAMWKNQIKPGTVINLPTSHMDILPTLMSVWGQELPNDRVIDGRNIYPLLTGKDNTPPHRFLMHYCGTGIHSARYTPDDGGDVYKLYYYIPNWLPGTYRCEFMCYCGDGYSTHLTKRQLYNIGRDPSEKNLLSLDKPENQKIVSLIEEAVDKHRGSLQTVPDQLAIHRMIPLPWLQPCCNFPYCNCRDENN